MVTASKEPVLLRASPAAVYVLTQDDIRRSGATSIPEVLRLVPGVEVARIDSNKWAVGIRGFGTRLSKSLLVLIDGRSVYTTLFAGVYWDAQDTLLEDVERIEVIRGPGGTIWGPNAVNGVINIITRNARDTQGVLVAGERRKRGSGHRRVSLRSERRRSGLSSIRQGVPPFARVPHRWERLRRLVDGAGGIPDGPERTTAIRWSLQGDLYRGDAGNRLAVSYYSPPRIVNEKGDAEISGGNVLGRWRRRLDSGSDIQILAYYDRASRRDLNFAEVATASTSISFTTFRGNARRSPGVSARDSSRAVPNRSFPPSRGYRTTSRTSSIPSSFRTRSISSGTGCS